MLTGHSTGRERLRWQASGKLPVPPHVSENPSDGRLESRTPCIVSATDLAITIPENVRRKVGIMRVLVSGTDSTISISNCAGVTSGGGSQDSSSLSARRPRTGVNEVWSTLLDSRLKAWGRIQVVTVRKSDARIGQPVSTTSNTARVLHSRY